MCNPPASRKMGFDRSAFVSFDLAALCVLFMTGPCKKGWALKKLMWEVISKWYLDRCQ